MARKISNTVTHWTADRLPDLAGKTYVITGGNAGLGFETAKLLGVRGADLVIAGRSPDKVAAAVAALAPQVTGQVAALTLDLAELSSVRAAAEELRGRVGSIDALINNAGIMQTPQMTTRDGFELQFGTNHLGHFLWTGLLLDRVEAAEGRVVTVASIAHKLGRMNFDDLMHEKNYDPTRVYAQSKLANLIFSIELDRRLKAAGSPAIAVAAHPGYSATQLQSTGPKGFWNALYKVVNPLLAQSAEKGALPIALAAAGPEAVAGAYYGPTGFQDARGPVGDATVEEKALNPAAGKRLWAESERLLGMRFEIGAAAGETSAA